MTPERFKRISDMLAQRQLDLTVCMEEVHKPHNLAAIVRTCRCHRHPPGARGLAQELDPQAQGHRPRQPELGGREAAPDIGSAVAELRDPACRSWRPTSPTAPWFSCHRLHQTHRHPGGPGEARHRRRGAGPGRSPSYRHPHGQAWCSPSTSRSPPPPSLIEAQSPAANRRSWPGLLSTRLSTGRLEEQGTPSCSRGVIPSTKRFHDPALQGAMPYPSSVRPARSGRIWNAGGGMQLTHHGQRMGRPTIRMILREESTH